MKTFKQHIKEEGEGIGTHDQNAIEDGSMQVIIKDDLNYYYQLLKTYVTDYFKTIK